MKKTLTIIFVLFAVITQAQVVQFDTVDVQRLREIVFSSNPKGLSAADETLFRNLDKQISKKGAINLAVVPLGERSVLIQAK